MKVRDVLTLDVEDVALGGKALARVEGRVVFVDRGLPGDRVRASVTKTGRRFAEAVLISPLLLLAKKRKHFLTVGYTDEQGRQQALVFQVHKGAVRSVLVSLEAKTGRKVQFQDDEARKAGKG